MISPLEFGVSSSIAGKSSMGNYFPLSSLGGSNDNGLRALHPPGWCALELSDGLLMFPDPINDYQ